MKLQAQVNFITTIAGTGAAGFFGENCPASNAKLNLPSGVCVDNFGNMYVADAFNHRVRKIVLATGNISTLTGTDSAGYNGDNIAATSARLLVPQSVFTDSSGNVFIADGLNHRIRKVTVSTGIISTVAGNGVAGYSGDGNPATNAQLNGPTGVSLDKHGNIYIADSYNQRIRKVDALTGNIITIAGDGSAGYFGDGGPATAAKLNRPAQAFPDKYGNVFFTDVYNSVVRKIDKSTEIISRISGTGISGYSGNNGLAVNAQMNQPFGIFIDTMDNIFIDEWGSGTIRRIDGTTGIIMTVAGTGVPGYSGDGGPATAAKLKPDGVFVDRLGVIYIADMDNHRIRAVYNPQLGVPNNKLGYEIVVYPNPTRNELNLENADETEVRIYNMLGQEVFTTSIFSNKQTLNLERLSSGMYVVEFVDSLTRLRTTKRLIISK